MKYKNANALRFGSDQPRDAGPLLSQNEAGRQKSWLQAANFYAVKPKQITKIVNMFSKLRQGQELFTKPCATCSPTPTFFNFQGHFVTMVSQHCCDIIIDDINATQSSTHNSQEKTRDRNKLASLLVKGRCKKTNAQCYNYQPTSFQILVFNFLNRRIESRKLIWKAETKLDTKNSDYIKMLGHSVEEGLDKKAKVNK